jgi:hypothetical protein
LGRGDFTDVNSHVQRPLAYIKFQSTTSKCPYVGNT